MSIGSLDSKKRKVMSRKFNISTMKKGVMIAFAAALISCSHDDVVKDLTDITKEHQTPIGFSVHKQNITRSDNLEAVSHYNFGVWAWKVQGNDERADAEMMNNYLVGYSDGISKGYDKSMASTWAKTPWFYENLGTAEYTYNGTAGFYKADQKAYMSAKTNQSLQYWDLKYEKTNFYCYAPYDADVTFTKGATTSTMTFAGATTIRDGYDEPLNPDYDAYDRSLSEFMYAGVQATNANEADIAIPFKHMGAQLLIRFYEDIPGYQVELIDLGADGGTMAEGTSAIMAKGIQAAPAVKSGATYTKGSYYTTQGATITFAEATAAPTYTANWTGSTNVQTPLMFKLPEGTIKEKTATGTQTYSYSPTIYYPVAQPTTSTTGFTFHVSYRIIAEDNKEVITIHNATVHVPVSGTTSDGASALITAWQPNVRYVYTFKFTTSTTGTTDPGTSIDPTDPTPGSAQSLFPIVFDAATIADYTETLSEYVAK